MEGNRGIGYPNRLMRAAARRRQEAEQLEELARLAAEQAAREDAAARSIQALARPFARRIQAERAYGDVMTDDFVQMTGVIPDYLRPQLRYARRGSGALEVPLEADLLRLPVFRVEDMEVPQLARNPMRIAEEEFFRDIRDSRK